MLNVRWHSAERLPPCALRSCTCWPSGGTSPATTEAAFDLVGTSSAIEQVRKAIARAANAPFTVLIEGESGSGKELVARAIHRAGSRRERRYSAFNCAAMPEDLVDAELFGHAKGAFTGAATERLGLFESAEGGTVFLDEVGELSARAQAKVLRVLQEGEIRRIGENFTRPFDARLVAATNCSLRGLVDAGRFRQDLLYRLDVIRINVPPLRERVEDIPAARGAILAASRRTASAAKRSWRRAPFARSRDMIGLATFESFTTSSPRSSSRFRSAVSSAHRRCQPRSRERRTCRRTNRWNTRDSSSKNDSSARRSLERPGIAARRPRRSD